MLKQAIQLNNNMLSGRISSNILVLSNLHVLDLSFNSFTGSLDGLFSNTKTSRFPFLQLVVLSSNAFTGTLPSAVFQLPQLSVLVLYSNCMSGSLPPEMCGAKQLSVLVLDALTSAPVSDQVVPLLLKPIVGGVFPNKFMTGGPCICLGMDCLEPCRNFQTQVCFQI